MVKKITAPADVTDVTAKPPGEAAKPDYSALDALEKQAEKNEKEGAQATQQQEQKQEKQEVDTLAADLLDALNMAAAPAEPAMWWLTPEQFETLWGKKVRKGIADPGAEIMRRNGISLGGLMNQYGPYVALFTVLAPSVVGTVAIYKAKKQEQLAPAGGGGSGGA